MEREVFHALFLHGDDWVTMKTIKQFTPSYVISDPLFLPIVQSMTESQTDKSGNKTFKLKVSPIVLGMFDPFFYAHEEFESKCKRVYQ